MATPLQDKIVQYETSVNPDMDTNVAYELADAMIQQKKKTGISISLQLAVVTTESKFEQYALGQDGEVGFFQLMTRKHAHKAFRMIKRKEISTLNLYDAHTNAAMGASVLRECFRANNGKKAEAVACYNGSLPTDKYTRLVLAREKKIRKILN